MKSSEIGKHIAQLREEKGYSQKELAEAIPVTQPTLSRWENGTVIPPLQQLERVCDVLGISLEQIFTGEKEEYCRLRKKLYRARTVSVSVAIAFLIIIVFAFVPKYRVVAEGNIYRSPYGETLPVYVKPIFILTEKGADSYGRKLAKRYADRNDLTAIEVILTRSASDPTAEDKEYYSLLFVLNAFSD